MRAVLHSGGVEQKKVVPKDPHAKERAQATAERKGSTRWLRRILIRKNR
jgi:hypothetical protein